MLALSSGAFRFHASGETIVRLEVRLGYTHKGVEAQMAGASLDRAARLAARPPATVRLLFDRFLPSGRKRAGRRGCWRGIWLRALMAELERIANHLGDIAQFATTLRLL